MKFIIVLAGILITGSALADTVCKPVAELNQSVQYCDDNFDYYDAAKACKEMYLKDVKKDQDRIRLELAAQTKLLSQTAQKQNMAESAKVLAKSIDDLDYLIEYGKQVHSEIEDYVYDLVLPAFDEQEGKADLNDPKVKAEFMSRECYGGPAEDMEALEKEIRPVVADLEKAKAEAVKLKALTNSNEGNLGSMGTETTAKGTDKGSSPKAASGGKSTHTNSDITGTEQSKKKQKAKP